MLLSRRLPLALASLAVALAAAPALAADKCLVKAVIGGKAAELKHCAVAVYDEQGVTLFFSETPIEKEEQETFDRGRAPVASAAFGPGDSTVSRRCDLTNGVFPPPDPLVVSLR